MDLGGDGDGDLVGTLPFGGGPVELWENRLEPQTGPDRILVFTRTLGFRHDSIEPGIAEPAFLEHLLGGIRYAAGAP